jgi:lysozyme
VNPLLKKRLALAGGGGTLAIAAVLGAWYEGDGPSVKQPDGVVHYVPYRDTGDVWTVCRGVTGPEVFPYKRYTIPECRALERAALVNAERGAKAVLRHYGAYNKWRQAALVDYTYNLGAGALAGSTMAKKFNAGDEVGGCQELARWVKGRVKGKLVTLPGLVDRRATEQELCLGAIT